MCVCVVLKTVVRYAVLLATPQRVAVKNLEYSGAHPWALTVAAFHFDGKMEWVSTSFSEGQGNVIFLRHSLFIRLDSPPPPPQVVFVGVMAVRGEGSRLYGDGWKSMPYRAWGGERGS